MNIKFVLNGEQATTFYPALYCKDGEMTSLEDTKTVQCTELFSERHMSKLMQNSEKSTSNEIEKNIRLNKIDPYGHFHLLTRYKCEPSNDIKTFAKANASKHVKEANLNLYPKNYILLLMPHGGTDLETWCEGQRNKDDLEQILVEMYRIFRGLYELQQQPTEERGYMVHGDVLPINVLYDKKTNRANLINFGNSMYSMDINPGKIKGEKQIFEENKAGFGPEWRILNENNDLREINDDGIELLKKFLKEESFSRELCKVFYWALSDTPERKDFTMTSEDDSDAVNRWCSLADHLADMKIFWRDFHNVIDQVKKNDLQYSYHAMLTRAIETIDMYGMCYTILYILGSLRKEFITQDKELDIDKDLYQSLTELCLRVVNGDVTKRITWLEFLTSYEIIFLNNVIIRIDPREQTKALPPHDWGSDDREWRMTDLLRRLGSEIAKDWDLQKQIENQLDKSMVGNTSPNFIDMMEEDHFYYDKEDFKIDIFNKKANLASNICIWYIYEVLKAFYKNYSTPFLLLFTRGDDGQQNNMHKKEKLTNPKHPWILVDMDNAMVSVYWPYPLSFSWFWKLDFNRSNTNNISEEDFQDWETNFIMIINLAIIESENDINDFTDVTQELINEHNLQDAEYHEFNPIEPLQKLELDHQFQKVAVMTKLTCMVLENLLKEQANLTKEVRDVSWMIRDYWAERLSTDLNALIKHNSKLVLYFFPGIFNTISKRDDDEKLLQKWSNSFNSLMTMKSSSQGYDADTLPITSQEISEAKSKCNNSLPDTSWLMLGLMEYTNTYILAIEEKNDTLSHSLFMFKATGSGKSRNHKDKLYAWTMPEYNTLDKKKIKLIIDKLQNGNKVHVVLPEISFNTSKENYYARWFLYDFQLETVNERKTLQITTPGKHAFEVTRDFARPLMVAIMKELYKNNDNKFINFIRTPRRDPKNKKNKSMMLLFVESLSSSWFTELKPPNSRVQNWLKECQQFLIQCGFTYQEIYDDICMCGRPPSECTLKNKLKIKKSGKEK
jgi:hypothetical protein